MTISPATVHTASRRLINTRGRLGTVVLVLVVLTCMLLWPEADGGRLRSSDGDQYESIAFNMLRYGVYHASPTAGEGRDLKPYFKREPGYPLFLAAVFALSPEFQSLTRSCIRDTTCQAAAALRQRAQRLTSVIQAVTVASAFLAAYAWTGSWLVSIAAALFYLVILPPSDIASVIAAFLLLVHAVFAAETWRSPRLSTGVLRPRVSLDT